MSCSIVTFIHYLLCLHIADFNHLDALEREVPHVEPAGVDLYKKLCRKLRFRYKPELFANPDLQVGLIFQGWVQLDSLQFRSLESIS